MNPFKSSLYWRLLLWFCAVNLLVLVLGGFLTRRFIEYTTAVEIDWSALAQSADQAYEQGGQPALADWVAQQRREGVLVEATLFENGQPLLPIRLPPSVHDSLPDMLAADRSLVLKPWRSQFMYLAVEPVAGADGQQRQLVVISRSHTRLRPQTREQILFGVQLALSLLFIGVVGWWVARSVSRPVEAMRAATRRMASGEFTTRVEQRWLGKHDELGQLARDFNAMAERIEILVAHERGVLQDLSHELRSPLARLHLILDLAQHSAQPDEAAAHFRRAEEEIVRMDRMTAEMLALSRLEGGLPGMLHESVDLTALLKDRVTAAHIDAEARGIVLQMGETESMAVQGSGLLLERAVDNVLANAIKFSPVNGVVHIGLTMLDAQLELRIRDHGPGVPQDELDLLFRPFFRGTNAAQADGHGLGLAIVQRVMQAHGGDVLARNADHGGLEIIMRLPLRQPAEGA